MLSAASRKGSGECQTKKGRESNQICSILIPLPTPFPLAERSLHGRTGQDEIDTRNRIYQKKMAKESISRFVSPEESGVASQKFKSRRQLLPQPVAGFEFAKQSGRQDLNQVNTHLKSCYALQSATRMALA